MLRYQIATLALSALAAFLPGTSMFATKGSSSSAPVRAGHFTSAPSQTGGLAGDDAKAESTARDFKGAGFQAEETWGDAVDRRLTELERKVALCPCSNGTAAPATPAAPAAGTTTKEAVVRSDMKPQEVVDTLTKLGFKSTAPAAVSTVVSTGGSTGTTYYGASSGTSTVVSSPVVTTYETSSYSQPVYSGTVYSGSYSVPAYQPMRPLQNARAYRAASGGCRIVNGQMVCGGY